LSDVADPAALVRQWWDVWSDGDLDVIDQIVAEKFVRHGPQGTEVRTRAQVREDFVQYRESMEIATIRVDAQTIDGDTVWSRLTTTGVNLRTAEPVTMSWLQVFRVADGRLAELWRLYAVGVDWAED
jgi:ketosteroid isomerase-like protein